MSHGETIVITVGQNTNSHYKRLDIFLSDSLDGLSRSYIKELFLKQQINVGKTSPIKIKNLELKKMPPEGTVIEIKIPPLLPINAQPEDIPLEILKEDEYLAIINKPTGLVVHPAPGNQTGTLVNALLHHYPKLKDGFSNQRPGIVHRLDKGTSGVLVIAKDKHCYEKLIKLFEKHNINRQYQCITTETNIPKEGKISSTIGRHPRNRLKMAANVKNGKNAITYYHVRERFKEISHINLKLETGRTHQIRIHLSSMLKAPILCDPLYSRKTKSFKKTSYFYANTIKRLSLPTASCQPFRIYSSHNK